MCVYSRKYNFELPRWASATLELLFCYLFFPHLSRLVGFIILVVYRSLIDAGCFQETISFPGRARLFPPSGRSLGGSNNCLRQMVNHLRTGVSRVSDLLLLLSSLCEGALFSELLLFESLTCIVVSCFYLNFIPSSYFMRGGKEHARAPEPIVPDEEPRASGSTTRENATQQAVSGSSSTQPTIPDVSGQSGPTTGSPSGSAGTGIFQDVLVDCNTLVESYRKGEVSKATAYIDIQSKLIKALGDDRARSDAAFGSFIATIESHDAEVGAAFRKGRAFDPAQRSPSPSISIPDEPERHSDELGEPGTKRIKVDESSYAWVRGRQDKRTVLRDTLAKTLRLIEAYTIDPKATKRSLVNEPDCPEFPDAEWKNVIAGRSVNLDAVLSGQLSTTSDDPKFEKIGDLEISFGAVEPTKLVKNAGDWTIAWNRTVRAIVFAFPHRMQELTSYGEYIVNLFSVTHPSIHNRVITFDKAVRKRVGNVRNLELSDFEKFSDLKIAHMDSIGISVVSSASKEDGNKKGKRNKNWKKDEPCNKWNDGKCSQEEEDCRRLHVCNKCRKGGHKGKDCKKQ